MESSVWESLTNLYSLPKTLRFELKPVGRTLEHMRNHLRYDDNLQTFLADKEIKDAYNELKPVLDYLHEQFITSSLESPSAEKIDFSEYLERYRNKSKDNRDQGLGEIEKKLRAAFTQLYNEAAAELRDRAGKDKKGKDILTKKGFHILTENRILEYIGENIELFSSIKSLDKINQALGTFKGFFTYFGGFNQNRENYYETSKEADTAIASRVVHDNLPKFCDNILVFEAYRERYLNTHKLLYQAGVILKTKNGEHLNPISGDIFTIQHFNGCLSQKQIELYNEQVGNANYLINLCNQTLQKDKLPFFKKLFKQIGCGKKDTLFFKLTHEKKSEADKARNKGKESFSLEEILLLAKEAGDKYFGDKSDDGMVNSLPELIEYLSQRENYFGFYWSKAAINTISSKYFANWNELCDRLVEEKVFKKADRDSDENIKIPEAVELAAFFRVINETSEWKLNFFKMSVTSDDIKSKILQESPSASEALLSFIFYDARSHAQCFLDEAEETLDIENYSGEKEKQQIKEWLDHSLAVVRILKYFLVNEAKAKGAPIDAALSLALDEILFSENTEWFKWYDAIRNYLTQKPQDVAKENKLRLNFENGSLLSGWSDGQETNKASVILRWGTSYYLGILKKKNLFVTDEKIRNEIYEDPAPDCGRLILANLKFQTLAGKGFLGEFGKSYGEMGKETPKMAIQCLQKIIRDRYVKNYPLLKKVAENSYQDKKLFDKDIHEALANSYVCEFKPINWNLVERASNSGDMYLFLIHSKDSSSTASGRKNLQTIYWDTVFQDESPFQLSGGGEVFYRRAAIGNNEKRIKLGYEDKPFIVDGKRFTSEKFIFHCPIKINYKSKGYSKPEYAISDVNKLINNSLSVNHGTNFLGIDRGEKHLVYYSIVDQNGKILKQASLNKIGDKDYNELLQQRVGEHNDARQNWQTIGTIKELKEGYISQVVRKIADLAIEHNAYIVLENLNTGFKRSRQKIEKSVYQKLELALAKKLNFLVDKTAKPGVVGSATKALQLTPPVNNFGNIEGRPQIGIMLYVRANYTSQTDPVTGWRQAIYLKSGSQDEIKQEVSKAFEDICFDGKDYVFSYVNQNTGKEWKLYSGKGGKGLDRFRSQRMGDKKWKTERYCVVEILERLFEGFDKNRSLYTQLIDEGVELSKVEKDRSAWGSLRFAIGLIQQIRNTGTMNVDNDFLLSPVRDRNGIHFDSRQAKHGMPDNGDANGAYNIARKGILINEHIRRGYKLSVTDEEWDVWLSGKELWNKWLEKHGEKIKPKR